MRKQLNMNYEVVFMNKCKDVTKKSVLCQIFKFGLYFITINVKFYCGLDILGHLAPK